MIGIVLTAGNRRAPAGRAGGVLGAVALAFAVAGCGGSQAHRADPAKDVAQAAGVQKGKPQLREPAPARAGVEGRYAPERLVPAGKPGQVLVENGPFIDRLKITDLSLRPGAKPRVSGALSTGFENSTLISMGLEVDFYDENGRLVGKGTRQYGRGPILSRKALRFSVRSQKPAPSAVTALLAVPDLVNE